MTTRYQLDTDAITAAIDMTPLKDQRELDKALETAYALARKVQKNCPNRTIFQQQKVQRLDNPLKAIRMINMVDSVIDG